MENKGIGALTITLIAAAAIVLCALSYYGVPWDYMRPLSAQNIKQGLDLQGGVFIVYEAEKDNPTADEMASVEAMIQGRLDRRGWTEAEVALQGNNRIRVDIPGVYDVETAKRQIGSTARLTFRDGAGNVLVDGIDVNSAFKTVDNSRPGVVWAVGLEFNSKGATDFYNATAANVGNPLYIYLDEDVISFPNVNEPISGGNAIITGNFTSEDADELAALIRAGSLPFNLIALQSREIGAKLGENALGTSLLAGLIGICLVVVFMLAVYRLAGAMASIALLMYTGLILVLLSAFGVTLTLPGIAGIILSIGMAVDANIIIFERLKEELKAKKTLRTAVDHAFKRAFSAILDSNITTLIVTLVLWFFGTGPVKGFAQTLALGTLISMFTAIVITRSLLRALVKTGVKNPSLFRIGLKNIEPADADNAAETEPKPFIVVESRKRFFIISAGLLTVGLAFMIVNAVSGRGAFNLSVEFTGGLAMTLDVGEDFDNDDIAEVITNFTGQTSPQIQRIIGTNSVSVKLQSIDGAVVDDEEQSAVQALIRELVSKYPNLTEVETENVSATIGAEMQLSAIIAVLLSCAAMLIYISLRFRDFGIGGAVVLGLLYDGLIVLAGYAILRTPMNYAFIAAILTVLGYSINASIVMFDRLRENKKLLPNAKAAELMNTSIKQTLTRSVFTTLTTLFTVVMIAALGVQSVREFLIPIIIGLLSGTYSSLLLVGGFWFMLTKRFKKA